MILLLSIRHVQGKTAWPGFPKGGKRRNTLTLKWASGTDICPVAQSDQDKDTSGERKLDLKHLENFTGIDKIFVTFNNLYAMRQLSKSFWTLFQRFKHLKERYWSVCILSLSHEGCCRWKHQEPKINSRSNLKTLYHRGSNNQQNYYIPPLHGGVWVMAPHPKRAEHFMFLWVVLASFGNGFKWYFFSILRVLGSKLEKMDRCCSLVSRSRKCLTQMLNLTSLTPAVQGMFSSQTLKTGISFPVSSWKIAEELVVTQIFSDPVPVFLPARWDSLSQMRSDTDIVCTSSLLPFLWSSYLKHWQTQTPKPL